jgi:hypothetical protein
MVMATQLSAVLYAGSRVTCHIFLNLRLCFSKLSRPGTSLLKSESVILLLESLYAEAIGAVPSRAALSASFAELIWILGEITRIYATKSEVAGWPSVESDSLVQNVGQQISELSSEFPQISHTVLYNIITVRLGCRKFCATWVPKMLMGAHKTQRMASALTF